MKSKNLPYTINQWAEAIALRISDEWEGNSIENKDDVELLRRVLERSLKKNPRGCKKLIGTTIIEESYFEKFL